MCNGTVFLTLDGTLVGSGQPCFVSPKTHGNALFWENRFQERVFGDQWDRETLHHACCQSLSDKRGDIVGELKGAEMCVSHMPSWKAEKLGKRTQEKVLLEL